MISKSFKVGSSLFIIILLFINFMSSYNSIEVNSQKVLGISNDYDYLDSLYNFESDNNNFANNNNKEGDSFLVENKSNDDESSNKENVHSIDKYYIVKEHEIINDEENLLDNSNITSNSTDVIFQNNTDAADVKEIIDILSSNQISELIKALKNDSLMSQDSTDNSSDSSDDFIEIIQTAAGEETQTEKINDTDRNITVNLYGDGDAYIYQEKGGNLRKIQFNRIKDEELIEEKEVKDENSLTNTEEIEGDSLNSKEKIEIVDDNQTEDEFVNTNEIDDTDDVEDTEYENDVDDEDIDYIFNEYDDEDIEYDDE